MLVFCNSCPVCFRIHFLWHFVHQWGGENAYNVTSATRIPIHWFFYWMPAKQTITIRCRWRWMSLCHASICVVLCRHPYICNHDRSICAYSNQQRWISRKKKWRHSAPSWKIVIFTIAGNVMIATCKCEREKCAHQFCCVRSCTTIERLTLLKPFYFHINLSCELITTR